MTNSGETGTWSEFARQRVRLSADGVKPDAEEQLAATRMNGGMAHREPVRARARTAGPK
jgi:hypothetical protein